MADEDATDPKARRAGRIAKRSASQSRKQRLLVVLCTVGEEGSAQAMARILVEERLAACVSRVPVQSTYRWREAVVSEGEVLLVIKTEASLWPTLRRRIRELHAYECPEIVGIDATESDADYLAWLLAACGVVA